MRRHFSHANKIKTSVSDSVSEYSKIEENRSFPCQDRLMITIQQFTAHLAAVLLPLNLAISRVSSNVFIEICCDKFLFIGGFGQVKLHLQLTCYLT